MNLPNFLIGGTNKAGTTSVFRYLSEHPDVCGSNVKETGFFVNKNTGNYEQDRAQLGKYFAHCSPDQKVIVEASTSYLALADEAIPRIKMLLGEPKVMFILRNPIDRIYSYFNFHKGHLSIPEHVSFERYLELCRLYDAGALEASEASFDEWHLKAPGYGRYSHYLKMYLEQFHEKNINVLFFDDLKKDPKAFMLNVCRFVGISSSFYNDYEFQKTNVTFSSKNKVLHQVAVTLNRSMERFLRQTPELKARMVTIYKRLNMAKQGYDDMLPVTRMALRDYYAESQQELASMLKQPLPKEWK